MTKKEEKKEDDMKKGNVANREIDSPEKTLYDAEVEYRKKTSRDSFTRLLFVSLMDNNCSVKSKVDSKSIIQQDKNMVENNKNDVLEEVCEQSNNVVTKVSKQKTETEYKEKSIVDNNERNIDDNVEVISKQSLLSILSKWISVEDLTSKKITGCLILSHENASIFQSKSDQKMNEEDENNETNGNNTECSLLALLEGPPKVIYEILQEVQDSPIFHSTRILLASEDCPQREFNNYWIFSINCNDGKPKKNDNLNESLEEDGIATVDGILRSLSKAAKQFPYYNKARENDEDVIHSKAIEKENLMEPNGCSIDNLVVSSEDMNDGIHSNLRIEKVIGKLKTSIPSYSRIVSCAKSDFYCSVDEFLEIFSSPIHVELESENIHPLEPTIRYDDDLQNRLLDAYHNENI